MKLLIIMNYHPNKGGLCGQIEELRDSLKNEGFTVNIYSVYGSPLVRMAKSLKVFFHARSFDRIIGVGSAFRGFYPMVVASLAARIWSKFIVFDFHDGQAPLFLQKHYKLAKWTIRNSPIIAASRFVADEFAKYGFKVKLIPYHFHFEKLKYPRCNNVNQWKKVIWARAFFDLYQPEMALQAARIATQQDKHLEFDFYGDGPLLSGLKERYKHPNIRFLGRVSREIFLTKYADYSIFINTTGYDNFPLSIVEAGLNNLLVVTTCVGGISTLYSEEEVLFFNDAIELANKILEATSNPEKYQNLRENLHHKIMTYSWDRVKYDWLKILGIC